MIYPARRGIPRGTVYRDHMLKNILHGAVPPASTDLSRQGIPHGPTRINIGAYVFPVWVFPVSCRTRNVAASSSERDPRLTMLL